MKNEPTMSNQIKAKTEKSDSFLTIAQAHPKLFFGLVTTTFGVSIFSSLKWKTPQPLVVTSGLVAVGALQFWNVFNPKPKPKPKLVRERANSVPDGNANPPRLKRVDSVRVNQFSNTPPEEFDEEDEPIDSTNYEALQYPFYDFLDSPMTIKYGVDSDGNKIIKAATKYKLIEKLTEETGYGASRYLHSFLLTYRSFMTPRNLLDLLEKRYSVPEPEGSIGVGTDPEKNPHLTYRKHIQLRVWYVLKIWTEQHFYDFEEDPQLIKDYDKFLDNTMMPDMNKLSGQLKKILNKKLENRPDSLTAIQNMKAPPSIIPEKESISIVLEIDPLEIARQLTLIEYDLYNKIMPKECLGQGWNKEQKETNSPHIYQLIQRFNMMGKWVVSEIVKETDTTKRGKLIEHFLGIAHRCRELNNFNSMMGIFAGLTSSSVSRLKKTWELVPQDLVSRFEQDCSILFSKNYKLLRDAVKQSVPPSLPYLGIFLSDLVFIEDGNSDTSGKNKLINFEKRLMLSRVITDLRLYQQKQYTLRPVEQIQQFINKSLTSNLLTENDCYKLSLVCEPRAK